MLVVRKYLFSKGFRYRIYDKKLPGKPDIVLRKYKTVIFIHGCFWHSHKNCKYFKMPTTRQEYWIPKINGNISKDKKHISEIKKLGWRVYVIWECELIKNKSNITLEKLIINIIETNH